MPSGTAISTRGNGIYADDEILTFDLGLLNSSIADSLVKLTLGQSGHPQFDIGDLSSLPVPQSDAAVSKLACRAWSLRRALDSFSETSHAFTLPAILQVIGNTLNDRIVKWSEYAHQTKETLACIQADIDIHCLDLYRLGERDRCNITSGPDVAIAASDAAEDEMESDIADADDSKPRPHDSTLGAGLISWGVGVAFGRFDFRLATGERAAPSEPGPFDALPRCSPGMLTGEGGLPLEAPPPSYPIAFPRDGILADDPGDSADITGRVHAVFGCIFGAEAERMGTEAAQMLGRGDGDLRAWLSRSFFDDTISRYSKSRRKAPIYWQLATPAASYSVWLYYPHLTKDTFYTVLSDHVGPKLQHEERQLGSLLAECGDNPGAAQRRQIAEQEGFVEELRAFREDIARIAPLWNPKHDDGVIINFAPLWRLVPQHRAWQRECKECWDKLVAGDYEWSHLAMHLWPERVVGKCAHDRSLAIAHGLEDRLWVKDLAGRWRPRQAIDGTVRYLEQQLCRER